ncbi:hypothetical protein HPB51_023465 [Rhipicephalus microplus]|uniref:Uncharacterized protein n=1 Tax=Rhipicephalus microplus TaxID=6941 RepID=A0A9J6F8I5_RHIMP|nr:hypothetical protein HPB51_023465 [Rhipicephalus microplus]
MNTKEPDEDVKTETSDYDFNNMASVFQACRKGEKKKDDFAKKFTAAFDPAWNLKPTFRPDAEADSAISTLHDYHEKLNFFPLGDINVAKADDEEAKNTPTFTALQVTDEKIIDVGGTETSKLGKGLPDICTEVYKQDQCRFLSVNSRSAFGVPLRGAAAATIMNWAMMKFVILFAPFLPSDDPSLLPFYQLVALFHRRAEMPHKDILCMHILERYYSDTLQWLINKDDYLNNVKAHMQQAVSKLDSQVSALGAKGQEDFFTMQLAYPKSPFPPEMIKRVPLKPFVRTL